MIRPPSTRENARWIVSYWDVYDQKKPESMKAFNVQWGEKPPEKWPVGSMENRVRWIVLREKKHLRLNPDVVARFKAKFCD